ncbi:MAG: DUF4145 domain-containing protein [Clostridiales bacterium]|nr:DUF4145 domain-containing protein [Clostridiales bacterium]
MKNSLTRNHILETCYHCGNKGLLIEESLYLDKYYDYDEDVPILWYEDYYHVLHCPVCHGVTLLKRSTDQTMQNRDGSYDFERKILYPDISTNKRDVPKNIVSAFESAKKVEKIDSSICALSLRKVLELICKDKKAKGSKLEKQIEDLVTKNILPVTFDDACKHIRLIGNEGAHDDHLSIPKSELKTLIEFLDSIINYLYIIPAKIKRLTEIKTDNKSNN